MPTRIQRIDRVADAYLETQRHLYNIIEALPEQEN